MSPLVLADALAGLVVLPELDAIFPQLFAGAFGGFRVIELQAIAPVGSTLDFGTLEVELRRNEILPLALQRAATGHRLEFVRDKSQPFPVAPDDRLVIARTGEPDAPSMENQ